MVDYTRPVETTFQLQRTTIEQGRRMLEQSVDLQHRMSETAIDSLGTQETAQRRVVELQQETFHAVLDALEENVPGIDSTTGEVRETVDDQFEAFLENHAEFFENLNRELEDSADAYDDLSVEYLDALEELTESVINAHEDIEEQSVDAVQQFEDQLVEVQEQLQEQAESVQEQLEEVSTAAADTVEA